MCNVYQLYQNKAGFLDKNKMVIIHKTWDLLQITLERRGADEWVEIQIKQD